MAVMSQNQRDNLLRLIIFTITIPVVALAYIQPEPIVYSQTDNPWYNTYVPDTVSSLDLSTNYSVVTPTESAISAKEQDGVFCYCVSTARLLGVNIPYGTNAEDFEPNTTPSVGALVLFEYSDGTNHVAVIAEISEEGLFVRQGNKEECAYSEEWIAWDNPFIRGFWAPQERSVDELMEDIAFCESGGRQHDENGHLIISETNDVGKYQINLEYHAKRARSLGMDLYTEAGNTEYAYLLFAEQGSNPWSASEHCWNAVN